MADAYWRYNQQHLQQQQQQQSVPPSVPLKRPRPDYDIPGAGGGHALPGYYSHEDGRPGYPSAGVGGGADSIAAAYDRYLRSGGGQGLGPGGGESGRAPPGGGRPYDDIRAMGGGVRDFDLLPARGISSGIPGGKHDMPLPPDASNTLFVECLPADCKRREVSHIFRPFVGFKEVRLVTKEAKHSRDDPLVLCFVDFDTPAQAATAMDALKGYVFDEHDRDSDSIRIQFARYPGPKSGGRPRGRR